MQKLLLSACSLLCLTMACKGPQLIHKNGLAFVEVGDPMPADDLEWFHGFPVDDTLFVADGFRWDAATLQLDSGQIVLEADFEGEGYVNRIRVETPELYTRKQLSVGSSVGDLQKKRRHWQMLYLENYGLLDVSSPRRPSIHYLVREPRLTPARLKDPGLQLRDLSPEAQVVAIVVM